MEQLFWSGADAAAPPANPPLVRSLSPSKVRAYLTCPRQYRFRYVERLIAPRPRPEPLVVGALLHRTVVAYLEERPTSAADALRLLARVLGVAAGEYAAEEIAPVGDQVAGLLLDLHRVAATLTPPDVADLDCELPLRARLGPLTLHARADVVWRAGGRVVHDEYKLSAPDPLQLHIATACVHLGLRQRPDASTGPIEHRLVVFRPTCDVRGLAFDEEAFRLALRRLWDLAARIGAERDWPAHPHPLACGACEFAGICDAAIRSIEEAPF
jgi:CRISPR/Cas system-associated exonuclease Cas4 (RecB family)